MDDLIGLITHARKLISLLEEDIDQMDKAVEGDLGKAYNEIVLEEIENVRTIIKNL